MQAKKNPKFLVESPSCAWVQRRRTWHHKKLEIGDTESSLSMQTHNVGAVSQGNRRVKILQTTKWIHLQQIVFSIACISLFLKYPSHCHGKNNNAHIKQGQTIISNYLSPPEGKRISYVSNICNYGYS